MQPPEVFCKKGIIKNFAKFRGKHLYQRDLDISVFQEFCEIFKNNYSEEHLRRTASDISNARRPTVETEILKLYFSQSSGYAW